MKSAKEPLFYIETLETTCTSPLSGIYSTLDGSTTVIMASGDVDTRRKAVMDGDEVFMSMWSVILGVSKTRTTDRDFPFSEELMRRTPLKQVLLMEDVETKRMVKFIQAVASHPQVECQYKDMMYKHAPAKYGVKYRIVIPEYEKNRVAQDLVNRINATVLYSGMKLEMQRDVAFYYGFNAEGYDRDGLLIDFFETRIASDADKVRSFLNKFTDSEVLDDGIADLVVIKKAMLLSQDSGQPFDYRNSQFFLGETYIGSDAHQILSFFKERPMDFRALCASMRDTITPEEEAKFLANKGVSVSSTISVVADKVVKENVDEDVPVVSVPASKSGKGKGVMSTKKSDDDDAPY